MSECVIYPSRLEGSIQVPSSKSQSMRAVLFAALADGESRLENLLNSPDVEAMIEACRTLGVEIKQSGSDWLIYGCGGTPKPPRDVINAGMSGLVLRLVGGVGALTPGYTVITGHPMLCEHRLVEPLLKGLKQWGALAHTMAGNNKAPIVVRGPLSGGIAHIEGQDSQPVSAMLLAGAFSKRPCEIYVSNPGELPWVDLTLTWFDRLGIVYDRDEYNWYRLDGQAHYPGFCYTATGDWSSAAFPLVGALVTGSSVTLNNLAPDDPQGDRHILEVLESFGAEFVQEGDDLTTALCSSLQGQRIDCNRCIDALPILAVLGTWAQGETILMNASIARHKESNRLQAMVHELSKMGAYIKETEDGLYIKQSQLVGTRVSSHGDHRVAMALAVAGLIAKGPTVIEDPACVSKTYPDFYTHLEHLGAEIKWQKRDQVSPTSP